MDIFDVFRFSKIKSPEKIDNAYFVDNKSPLEEDAVEVIYPTLEW